MNTYQIYINLYKVTKIKVGKLGICYFPSGIYIYTGSAKKNMKQRITRHLSNKKNKHWHIDYLLLNKNSNIFKIEKYSTNECIINKKTKGKIVVRGFGSSDCKRGCLSHLKLIY